MLPLSRPIFAATTERIVSDPGSGLAIGGFDPVAYFTDAAPRLGSSDFELSFAGVVWRFRNEGNRAAFIANPEVYMPRFGGYDPVAVAAAPAPPATPNCGRSPRTGSICSTARRRATCLPALPALRSVPPNGSGPPYCARCRPRFFPPFAARIA